MVVVDGSCGDLSKVEGVEKLLCLETQNLYGFHRGVDKNKISTFQSLISKGFQLPIVPVVEDKGDFYMALLLDEIGKIDGGHHRAYSHYLKGEPLYVLKIHYEHINPSSVINIRDIEYRDNLYMK